MHTNRIRMLFLIVCLGCLFLCSCGLDEYYVIDPPSASEISKSQEDITQMVYSFSPATVNVLTSSQINMLGTAVYYRIFEKDDGQTLDTEITSVKSANTEYSENGINKIKEQYTRVTFSDSVTSYSSEYIAPSTSGARWTMRLKDDLRTNENASSIALLTATNGTDTYDVLLSESLSPGEYYINAYAVTVGEVSFIAHYSALAPLGVLKFTIE